MNIVHFHWSFSRCNSREPGNMHPCNSDAWIRYLPSLNYPKQISSRSSPHPWKCDENVAISGMHRLKGNVKKCGNQWLAQTFIEKTWINNYLSARYRRRRRRRWHTKAPFEIAAGSFVHMKEDVTGTSHTHGLEPPYNWATTNVCIKFHD